MANQKPKKSAKKTSPKSEKPEIKQEEVSKPAVVQTASDEPSLKGFFARKSSSLFLRLPRFGEL